MNVYKSWLLKKSSNRKSKHVLSRLIHYMAFKHRTSFATDSVANFGCYRFRITQDIVSKLLRAAIWSSCAVLFKSKQTPFSQAGRRFRSETLHGIQFGTCSFVLMSYFYLETNSLEWLIERLSKAMGAALVGNNRQPPAFITAWLVLRIAVDGHGSFRWKAEVSSWNIKEKNSNQYYSNNGPIITT